MQQLLTPFQDVQKTQNPETEVDIHDEKHQKKKKKKLKIKKYIKSPVKHQFFITNNPLYQALNHQDIINSSESNFGPWVKQEPKPKQCLFQTLEKNTKNQLITQLKNLQKPEKLKTSESIEMSKSSQFLPKFDSVTKSIKLQKNSSRNSTYFRVPVWNAFIEEQTISVSSNYPQIGSKKDLLKQRQTSVNFETERKKPNLHFVSIGSDDSLGSTKRLKFNIGHREAIKYSSTKGQNWNEYESKRMDLLEKIRANAVVYNYCMDQEGRTTPTLSNFKQSCERSTEKKVTKNLKKRKHEIYEQKLSEMELKLVVPDQRSKLIFLSQSQRLSKPSVSKYIFMDLLEMRNKAK